MARKAKQRISYVLPLPNQKGGHRLGVNGLAVDSNNSILYSGGRDGVICAWDVNLDLQTPTISDCDAKPSTTPQPSTFRQQVQAHTHWINDIALVQSNEALVSASSDITVKLWRPGASDGLPPQPLGLHNDYVKVLAVPSPTSDWIASGGLDRKINLWELNGGGQRLSINVDEDEAGSLSSKEKGSVYALAATENMIASGGPESTVRVWDSRTGKRITKLAGHTDNIRDVLLSQDGTTILSASSDRTVKVWSTVAGRCMFTLTMHDASVWSLFSPDPDLSIFFSSDKNGLVAKTDTRNTIELDEGLSVAIAQEHEGVHKVVSAGDYIWTATSRPSINRWRDVNTDNVEIDIPENYSLPRASIASTRMVRMPSPTSPVDGGASHRRNSSGASSKSKIPLKHMLRLSNAAYFPTPIIVDGGEKRPSIVERAPSRQEEPEVITMQPVRSQPDYAIEGQNGLIKHALLNDRKRVLTLDTAGEVVMWDLLKCVPIKSFGKRDLDDVKDEHTTNATVANWCTVDTRTGSVAVILEENTCFDAEMYADELDLDDSVEFREDQRINLGKWVLRYLFSNLISEEIRKDGECRQKLLSAREDKNLRRDNAPRSIPMPQAQTNGWHQNGSAGQAPASTLRANNGTAKPNNPSLVVGPATPSQSTATSTSNAAISSTTLEEERKSSERSSSDYFTTPQIPAPNSGTATPAGATKAPMTPSESAIDDREPGTPSADDSTPKGTPSGKEAGLFGKKFSMRGMSFGSMKKIGRTQTGGDKDKPAAVEEKEEAGGGGGTESDSRSSKTSHSRTIEDNFLGVVQKIRFSYEDSLQQQLQAQAQHENGLPVSAPSEISLTSAITPSPPSDTPVLKPPLNTTILIQEERPEAGGVADLFEGTVGSLAETSELVEKAAPMWLGDVLLKNQIPAKEVVKVSFVLEPVAGCGLPAIASDGNNRLNANRMLRAKKVLGYIAERIEPMEEEDEKEKEKEGVNGGGRLKPEEYLELWCQNQLVPPTMTLATIRSHLWRGGGDVSLFYKANGKKEIKHVPPGSENNVPVKRPSDGVPAGDSGVGIAPARSMSDDSRRRSSVGTRIILEEAPAAPDAPPLPPVHVPVVLQSPPNKSWNMMW